MYVSGSIGIVILSKKLDSGKDKVIIILSDDHATSNYCSVVLDNNKSITEFFDNNSNSQILLEEIPKKNNIKDRLKIEDLWYNIPHVKELKNYFLNKSKNSEGVDIRLELIPFSIEALFINSQLLEYKVNEYINDLEEFLNGKGTVYFTYFHPFTKENMKNLISNERENETFKNYFLKLYNELIRIKDKASKFIDKNPNPKFSEIAKKDHNFLVELMKDIEILTNLIMEFYVILKLYSSEKSSFIHMGLYHTSNIVNSLIVNYNFKILHKSGETNFPPMQEDSISCIKVPNLSDYGIE